MDADLAAEAGVGQLEVEEGRAGEVLGKVDAVVGGVRGRNGIEARGGEDVQHRGGNLVESEKNGKSLLFMLKRLNLTLISK